MIKRHFFIVAAAVLLGLMVLAAVLRIALADDDKGGAGGPGGGRGGPGGGRGQAVAVTTVAPHEFSDTIQVLGVARGLRSVTITSTTTELITRVLFRDGQRVAAGQPLVELQAREEDADLIEARARLAQAERENARFKDLAERGVAPRVTAENAETALETARAALAAAQARLGDRVIRAPFAGTLGLTSVTAGTLINPGAVITTLDDTRMIRIDFPVPERFLGQLRTGTPIVATSDAFPGQSFSGRIALIDSRVNEQTRAATARAEFPNPGGAMRPGMLMRVAVRQGARTAASAPEAAVQYEGQRAFVFRIARGEQGSTAQRIEIEPGVVENGFVEILSGVETGDRLVGSGLNRIQPGAPVSPVGEGGAPNQGAASRKSAQ